MPVPLSPMEVSLLLTSSIMSSLEAGCSQGGHTGCPHKAYLIIGHRTCHKVILLAFQVPVLIHMGAHVLIIQQVQDFIIANL